MNRIVIGFMCAGVYEYRNLQIVLLGRGPQHQGVHKISRLDIPLQLVSQKSLEGVDVRALFSDRVVYLQGEGYTKIRVPLPLIKSNF